MNTSNRRRLFSTLAAAGLVLVLSPGAVLAAQGDCSQPVTNGSNPTASDCLFILRAAVGSATCDPACVCAPKGSLPTTATDALICLKKAVGQAITLDCPCPVTTTSSTTLSTTTSSTTLPDIGANITIVNADGDGEGFDDPSPRAPFGGNDGTTLGQQRLNVFERAARIWEGVVTSDVEIRVAANFDPLTCNSGGAVLGFAGAANYLRNFTGATRSNTWFPVALANKLATSDLDPDADIFATFNSAVGTTCPFPNVWYYGLDGNAPADQIDLVSVVLHEIGHGLGFATIVDLASGQEGSRDGLRRQLHVDARRPQHRRVLPVDDERGTRDGQQGHGRSALDRRGRGRGQQRADQQAVTARRATCECSHPTHSSRAPRFRTSTRSLAERDHGAAVHRAHPRCRPHARAFRRHRLEHDPVAGRRNYAVEATIALAHMRFVMRRRSPRSQGDGAAARLPERTQPLRVAGSIP